MASVSSSSTAIRRHAVYGVVSILLGIAVIVVALRAYVRLKLSRNFGLDDGVIVFTLGLLVAGDVCIYNMMSNGMGRHLSTLPSPEESALQILKWNTIYQPINVIGALSNKIAIGLFILRIHNSPKFKRAIWVVMTPLAITTVILTFVVLLQCIPLRALWHPSLNGHCISAQTPLNVSYVQSGFAIIADIFLTASPIAILWNIRISLKRKVAICGLMSIGLVATIANALRNVYIPDLTESDISYTIVPIVIVSILEFSLGIIAACLVTLMPLFKTFKTNIQYGNTSNLYSDGSNLRQIRARRIPSNDLELTGQDTIQEARGSENEPLAQADRRNKTLHSSSWIVEHSVA